MSQDLFERSAFRWAVAEAGYEWVNARFATGTSAESKADVIAKGDQVRRLPPCATWSETPPAPGQKEDWLRPFLQRKPGGGAQRVYRPLAEHSGLFLEFAQTEPTRAGVIQFANRYGMLGEGAVVPIVSEKLAKGPAKALQPLVDNARMVAYVSLGWLSSPLGGEPLGTWYHHILSMRRVIDLWRMVQNEDEGGLAKHILWGQHPDGTVHVWYDSQLGDAPDADRMLGPNPFRDAGFIASGKEAPELLERFQPGDLVGPALVYIQRTIDKTMARLVPTRVTWKGERDRLSLGVQPVSLLGALWLQVASAVSFAKQFQTCGECGSAFEVSRQVARKSKRYCSDACRIRNFRARQERARQMKAQHRPVKEIARALDTDVETVKKWVKTRKE
jgi:hypothetical protein